MKKTPITFESTRFGVSRADTGVMLRYGETSALLGSRDTSRDNLAYMDKHGLLLAHATSQGLRLQGSRSRDHTRHSLAWDIPKTSHNLGLALLCRHALHFWT